jgi:hypothetical protein
MQERAEYVMTGESYAAALARKLRVKPGQTALALDAPEEYVAALRGALGDGAVATQAEQGERYDLVSLFARSRVAAAAGAPTAIAATQSGGALWIMWVKKTSAQTGDLDRDSLWALVQPLGWGPVTSISLDDDWSALRFRPEAEIGRK